MDATFTVEYNSTDAIATDFIERISLEMKKLGIFKFSNKKEKSSKSLENKTVENPLLEELEYIKKYPNNWDGEGAKPINDKVYANALSVITKCDPKTLAKWEISLNNNGSLYFSAIDEDAMINLGNYTFSYYVKRNGKKLSSSNSENYSAKALISVLKLI